MRRGLIWTFCVDVEVCLLLCMEGSPLPQDDMTMEFICDNMTIRETWYVASSLVDKFVVVKCWLVVQQGCKYVILAPLQTNKKDVCNRWKGKMAIPHIIKLSFLADEVVGKMFLSAQKKNNRPKKGASRL